MNFNAHFRLEGQHAFLGASNYHWINDDDNKLVERFLKFKARERGTQLHAFACQAINLGRKQPKTKDTLNMYVNDAIGFRMQTEQILYYSDNCFGTADTISFRENFLRIHDYKSGVSPAKMEQLLVYAALFCLEYNVKPTDIEIELRLYQLDKIIPYVPTPEEILDIMDKIIRFDKMIEEIKIRG